MISDVFKHFCLTFLDILVVVLVEHTVHPLHVSTISCLGKTCGNNCDVYLQQTKFTITL